MTHCTFLSICIAIVLRSLTATPIKRSWIVEQKGVSLFKRNSSALQNYGKYPKPPNCLSFFLKKIKNIDFSSSRCFAKMIIYSEIMPMYQLFSKTIFLLKREILFVYLFRTVFHAGKKVLQIVVSEK